MHKHNFEDDEKRERRLLCVVVISFSFSLCNIKFTFHVSPTEVPRRRLAVPYLLHLFSSQAQPEGVKKEKRSVPNISTTECSNKGQMKMKRMKFFCDFYVNLLIRTNADNCFHLLHTFSLFFEQQRESMYILFFILHRCYEAAAENMKCFLSWSKHTVNTARNENNPRESFTRRNMLAQWWKHTITQKQQ